MFRWTDVPLRDLADVLDWHAHHLELAEKRYASRTQDPRYKGFPRQIKRMQIADQKKIDLHRAVLGILKATHEENRALNARLDNIAAVAVLDQ